MKAIALLTAILSSSCYCFKPEHLNETKCVVLHQSIDCATDAVKNILPAVVAAILPLIQGGSPDWGLILSRLEVNGFAVAVCALQALQSDFMSHPQGKASADLDRFSIGMHATIGELKKRHGYSGPLKVKSVAGKVSTL